MRNPRKIPRAPYCTGCGNVFNKMHEMMNHRRTHRCGGRFLPADERELWTAAKEYMEDYENKVGIDYKNPVYFYRMARKCLIKAINLRKVRREQQS